MKEFLDDKMVADEYRKDIDQRKTHLLIMTIFFILVSIAGFILMMIYVNNVKCFEFILGCCFFISSIIFGSFSAFCYRIVAKYAKRIDVHNKEKFKK